jgi:DNA-binding NtrC family response regulator
VAVQATAAHVASIALALRTGIRLVRLVMPSVEVARATGRAVARELRDAGFVTVRAGADIPPAVRSTLMHRHLAVIAYEDRDAARAATWIQRLVETSPRAHLILDLRPAGAAAVAAPEPIRAIWQARERAPAYGETARPASERPAGADPRLARALACLNRRRGASGERWLRAALESGRRRGDDEVQAEAGCRLASALVEREQWEDARRLSLELLGRLRTWPARAMAAAVAARVLIATGDLSRAESTCAGLVAEAGVRDQAAPPVILLRQAEIRFWQGRFEEASDLVSRARSPSPEAVVWRGLVSWACGDPSGLDMATAALDPAASGAAPRSRLGRACAAERLLAEGQPGDALRVLGPRPGCSSGARLEEALLDWLRSRCAPDRAASAAAEAVIRGSGARGLTRWGLGRRGMHLLHAVPALLQIIHDADDEGAVLKSSCTWIRTHAEADAVAIVTEDGGRLVAADGFTAADLNSDLLREALRSERPRAVAEGGAVIVTAPIRVSGTAIGCTVVRGRAQAAATLAEAAAAVSSLCAPALRARLDAQALAAAGRSLAPEILGHSPVMAALREAIARAAATPFPVLIEGESGTGKELVARALHRLSARRDRAFCAVNCAALTDELVEAELFGYARGAFTGAVGARAGLFEEAHGGTLFLDEVSELSPRAQAKLLRAVQEREIRRLGENAPRPVNVRVLCATNRPLADAAGKGQFRDDLLFRLAVVRLRVPPLRERIEDVPVLVQAFWRRMTVEADKRVAVTPDAISALCRHHWPGNVRELQNAIAGLLVLAPSRGRVGARHVGQVISGGGDEGALGAAVVPLDTARRTLEQRMVAASLARHAGRLAAASRELGLTSQGLRKAMKRLGLEAAPGAEGVA